MEKIHTKGRCLVDISVSVALIVMVIIVAIAVGKDLNYYHNVLLWSFSYSIGTTYMFFRRWDIDIHIKDQADIAKYSSLGIGIISATYILHYFKLKGGESTYELLQYGFSIKEIVSSRVIDDNLEEDCKKKWLEIQQKAQESKMSTIDIFFI